MDQRAGDYELIQRLGRTRDASTWLAEHTETSELFVLKRISPSHDDVSAAMREFGREAEALLRLDHPGIPRYVDHFSLEAGGELRHCLVQSRVHGTSLRTALDEDEHFDEERVVPIAENAAEILAYMHKQRPAVIHRDLKPSNIMITPAGEVAFVDFGTVGSGSAGYAPLEQYEGRTTTASDVYALGVTLIELLSRRPPRDLPRRDMTIQFDEFVNVSPAFALLLEIMVNPSAERRPQTGGELLYKLERMRKGSLRSNNAGRVLAACPKCLELATPAHRWTCPECDTRFDAFAYPSGRCPECNFKLNTLECHVCHKHDLRTAWTAIWVVPESEREPGARAVRIACPDCSFTPPAARRWTCTQCEQRFDPFTSPTGRCTGCERKPLTVHCDRCQGDFPRQDWLPWA